MAKVCDNALKVASLHARKIGPISTVAKPLDEKVKRLASLEAVNPENYPRPDFSKYILYKPESALVDSAADDLPTVDFDVPDPITQFLTLLPTPKQYIGPRLPPDDVLTLLVQLPIPVPSGLIKQEALLPPQANAPVAQISHMPPTGPIGPIGVAPLPVPVNGDVSMATSQPAIATPRADPRLKRKADANDDHASSKIKKEEV